MLVKRISKSRVAHVRLPRLLEDDDVCVKYGRARTHFSCRCKRKANNAISAAWLLLNGAFSHNSREGESFQRLGVPSLMKGDAAVV